MRNKLRLRTVPYGISNVTSNKKKQKHKKTATSAIPRIQIKSLLITIIKSFLSR